MVRGNAAYEARAICGFYYLDPRRHHRVYLAQVSLSAHCTIIASTSRTTLTQTFANSSTTAIPELQYTFPIYDGVSVVGFTCTVNNDRVIRGIVKEKADARATYQDARDRGETAGLLENLAESSDVFTTSVANVPAGAELRVDIVYLGELKHDAEVDGIRFTIPTAIAPRYGEYPGELLGRDTVSAKGGIEIVVDAEMPAGSNIKSVRSPSHPISVTLGNTSASHAAGADMSLQRASAALSLGTAELDKDFVLQVVATNIGDPVAVLETHPDLPNQRALMATLVPRFNLPPMRPEVVFVCDRSGSMGGGGRIPSLKSALHVFLKSLPVGVKFNICSFGSNYELLFKNGSETYDAASLAKATKYVDTFNANFGGTQMYKPVEDVMKKRYKDMPLQVILLTDGEIWDQESLISLVGEQVKESDGEIRVFTLGIGDGVSHSLIEGVARAGNGFAQVVADNEKMNVKVVRMLKASLTPLVKDYTLELKYGSDPTQQQHDENTDDDFEIIEKVVDCLAIDVPESVPTTNDQPPSTSDTPKQPISLFDPAADPDVEMADASQDATARGKYAAVPPVPAPKLLQAPFAIPPLYPFNRTSVYLLLSPETTQRTPKSVVLRGTSKHGPLELEIPVSVVGDASSSTIHQLAARAAIRDLEAGCGWVHHARDTSGSLLKDKHPGRFTDMVEREAVRLGVAYQVANRWCSFVAVEDRGQGKEERPAGEIVASARPGKLPVQAKQAIQMHAMQIPQERPMFRARGLRAAQSTESKSGWGGTQMRQQSAPTASISSSPPAAPGVTVPLHAFTARTRSTRGVLPSVEFGGAPQHMDSLRSGRPEMLRKVALVPSDESQEDEEDESDGDVDMRMEIGGSMPAGAAGPALSGFDAVVARQSFGGSWAWDDGLFAALGIDTAALLHGAGETLGADELGAASDALATAVVLAFLESQLADRREEWEMLAEKAENWLDGNVPGGKLPWKDYVEAAGTVLEKIRGRT